MSKLANSRDRQLMRARVHDALAPFPIDFVLDEVVRRLGISGDGWVKLFVRDGFVTGKDLVPLPDIDPDLRRQLSATRDSPLLSRLAEMDAERERVESDIEAASRREQASERPPPFEGG